MSDEAKAPAGVSDESLARFCSALAGILRRKYPHLDVEVVPIDPDDGKGADVGAV